MDFNRFLQKISAVVAAKFPTAFLYECKAFMYEGGNIDTAKSRVIYQYFDELRGIAHTVEVTVSQYGLINIQDVPQAWAEDRPMTPYVAVSLAEARNIASESNSGTIVSDYVTLRHSLNKTIAEPAYYFTLDTGWLAVGANTGSVRVIPKMQTTEEDYFLKDGLRL